MWRASRRSPGDQAFTQITLDMILLRIALAAQGSAWRYDRPRTQLAGQVLAALASTPHSRPGRTGSRPSSPSGWPPRAAPNIWRAGAECPGSCDRPVEHDTLARVTRGPGDGDAADADPSAATRTRSGLRPCRMSLNPSLPADSGPLRIHRSWMKSRFDPPHAAPSCGSGARRSGSIQAGVEQ